MGFYGRTYTYTVNDYFKSLGFSNTAPRSGNTDNFPTDSAVLSAQTKKTLTATTPAETINIATGNKWIQFVVTSESADMNNSQTIATGLTIYHKKAERLTQDKIIDFSAAVMKNGEEDLKDGNNLVLGYGKPISVNDLSFDAAGHANGSEQATISYALPKVIESFDSGNTDLPGYTQAYNLQHKITTEVNNTEYINELKALIRDYPFSAAAIIKPMYDNTEAIKNHHEILTEGNDEVGRPGLIGQAKSLDSRVTEVENQIEEDILPALNLVPGIGKPGIEIDKANKTIKYSSFLSNGITYDAGNKGTVLNNYDLTSLEVYNEKTFTDDDPYKPNVYYDEDHILAKEAAPIEGKKYFTKTWGTTLKNTNHILGDYSLATGYGSRAFGQCAQAGNGYYGGSSTNYYITTAYGNSSHAEGRSDLRVQPLLMGASTNCENGAIQTDLDYGGLWSEADVNNSMSRRNQRVYVGLDIEDPSGKQVYKIYPAQENSGTINIASETLNGDKILGTPSTSYYEIYSGLAFGEASHSEGIGTVAEGKGSHSEGWGTIAIGDYSHAEGNVSFAKGLSSHAEGFLNVASGDYSHAEGYKTNASAKGAHTEGLETVASEEGAHSEGISAQATGKGAHAEGKNTIAQGAYSHVEGGVYGDATNLAKGESSHVEGGGCTAEGQYSHAGGILSTATSSASFASGWGVRSSHLQGSAAFGRWNRRYDDLDNIAPIFAIGDGTGESDREEEPEHRSDALRVWPRTDAGPGGLEVTGNVTVGNNLRIKGSNGKYYKLVIDDSGAISAVLDEPSNT